MASNQELNVLLELLAEQKEPPRIYESDLRELIKSKGLDIDMSFLVQMLTKLCEDGYILRYESKEEVWSKPRHPPNVYDRINYEIKYDGLMFINQGGYDDDDDFKTLANEQSLKSTITQTKTSQNKSMRIASKIVTWAFDNIVKIAVGLIIAYLVVYFGIKK